MNGPHLSSACPNMSMSQEHFYNAEHVFLTCPSKAFYQQLLSVDGFKRHKTSREFVIQPELFLSETSGFKARIHSRNSVRIIVSVLIWGQSWAAETERIMREKKGERCRWGAKERREVEGRCAWESCGRCLKMLKNDANASSHFTKEASSPMSSPPRSLLSRVSPWLCLRCLASVTPQHCSLISGHGAFWSQLTNREEYYNRQKK